MVYGFLKYGVWMFPHRCTGVLFVVSGFFATGVLVFVLFVDRRGLCLCHTKKVELLTTGLSRLRPRRLIKYMETCFWVYKDNFLNIEH